MSSRREQLCPSRFIPAAELDAVVWADLCTMLQTPELLADALQRARNGAWMPQALQQQQLTIRKARRSLGRQQERLLDAYLAGAIDLPTFEKRRQGLTDRDDELAAREGEILAQGQRLLDTAALLHSTTDVCARLRQNLDGASFARRRELVELLIDRVIVTDGDVEIRYVVPTSETSLHTRFCQLRQDYLDDPSAAGLDGRRHSLAGNGAVKAEVVQQHPGALAVVAAIQMHQHFLGECVEFAQAGQGRCQERRIVGVRPGRDQVQRNPRSLR